MPAWYVGINTMTAPTTTLPGPSPNGSPLRRSIDLVPRIVRIGIIAILTASAIYYACKTIHWQIMVDSSVMHYVDFLIDHGRKPYTEISDNNMPGAYYTESLAMHIFGYSDVGWRIYDYFLLAALTGGLILIARPYDWLAGLFAGGLFMAVHAAEGPQYAGEREQVITVLLVLGYAAIFAAVRRLRPSLMLWMGITGGLATSIKPTFLPLTLVLLAIMAVVLRRRKIASLPYLAWAFAGLIAIAALDFGYLLYYHALDAFIFILRVVTPTYTSLAREPFFHLLSLSLPEHTPVLLLLALIAAAACRRNPPAWTWEHWALAVGAAFGLASFMAQGKPFWHHRYTFLALLFLLIGLVLLHALKQRGLPRWIACIAFAYALLWTVQRDMREVLHLGRMMPAGQTPFELSLVSDLQGLGGTDALQDKVQCFDLVYGCLSALYHLRIVENTSYTGDLLFFSGQHGPAVDYYRTMYWEADRRDPASVIVMSNEWFQRDNSFDKVKMWPQFESFLHQNYTIGVQRRFAHQGKDPRNPEAYRIYIRNGSPLLQQAAAVQAIPFEP
jgi:hypothetical protein